MLIVVNSESSGPRRLLGWLRELGVDAQLARGAEGLPDDLRDVDSLVLLGGGFMPDADAEAPWLSHERALAREAIDCDLPTLGICLGAQLLALVAGGEVRAKTGPRERGATMILPTAAGREDAVVGALGEGAPMIENHEDMITRLPASATLLASSASVANQAFRIGAQVRGVQFHPEAGVEHLRTWDEAALDDEGISREALVREAAAVDAHTTTASRALIAAFVAQVRSA